MLSRRAKDLFYKVSGPLMYINGKLHKLLDNRKGVIKVQLGPGIENYFDGWVNVDANMFTGKCDIWADLRNDLPFKDGTVDFIYSHHVIEHLPNLEHHFKDIYRCLKKGGKIRIGGPNGDNAIKKFIENDKDWFSNYPDKRESIGGKFENFIFCRQEHLTILTYSFLTELATKAGFTDIKVSKPQIETNFPDFVDKQVLDKEWELDFNTPHTLLIEAIKA